MSNLPFIMTRAVRRDAPPPRLGRSTWLDRAPPVEIAPSASKTRAQRYRRWMRRPTEEIRTDAALPHFQGLAGDKLGRAVVLTRRQHRSHVDAVPATIVPDPETHDARARAAKARAAKAHAAKASTDAKDSAKAVAPTAAAAAIAASPESGKANAAAAATEAAAAATTATAAAAIAEDSSAADGGSEVYSYYSEDTRAAAADAYSYYSEDANAVAAGGSNAYSYYTEDSRVAGSDAYEYSDAYSYYTEDSRVAGSDAYEYSDANSYCTEDSRVAGSDAYEYYSDAYEYSDSYEYSDECSCSASSGRTFSEESAAEPPPIARSGYVAPACEPCWLATPDRRLLAHAPLHRVQGSLETSPTDARHALRRSARRRRMRERGAKRLRACVASRCGPRTPRDRPRYADEACGPVPSDSDPGRRPS